MYVLFRFPVGVGYDGEWFAVDDQMIFSFAVTVFDAFPNEGGFEAPVISAILANKRSRVLDRLEAARENGFRQTKPSA